MTCPDLEALERFATEGSTEGGDDAVARHVESCSECRAQLDEIRENLALQQRARDLRGEQATEIGPAVGSQEPASPASPDSARLPREPAEPATTSDAAAPSITIEGFRVIRELGRGGMGIVYLAEQERPRRRVALKVVQSADVSAEVLQRFEREADLLARFQHPFIARVLETGVADGRPYLAMEYVAGPRLDEWIPRARVHERLRLFAEICDAVHHAHSHGVLHRDLKPGNVLVEMPDPSDTTPDALAHPKVLDFGVARAIGDDLRTRTLRTEPGRLLGTVPFMSPEQVAGDSSRLDARSDVYALGVLVYWMLAGDLPYALRDQSLPEMARIIRDEDPASLATSNARYRGDLDTIVAKALEKEPERRYGSAAELAADVRRFLEDRPIVARAPSAAYQLRKFARRNRVLVASAAVLFAVLVAAAGVGSWLAVRATRAERIAREQLARAEEEVEKQEAVTGFLQDMLSASNPYAEGERATTVVEVLDRAAAQLDEGRFAGRPALEAAVRSTLGRTLWASARYDEASAQLERVLAVLEEHPAEAHAYVEALGDLGMLAAENARFEEAEATFRRQHARALRDLGPDHASTIKSLANLAGSLADQRRLAEAESVLVLAIRGSEQLEGDEREIHAGNLQTLAGLKLFRGDLVGAEAGMRNVIAFRTELNGPGHPATVSAQVGLAAVLAHQGRTEERIDVCREVLARQRASFGDAHPEVASALTSLGTALSAADRLDEAEPLLREAAAMNRATRGDRHTDTARSLNDLAQILRKRGRFDEAEPLYEESLAIYREVLGDDSPHVHTLLGNLAKLRRAQERWDEAESLFERVLQWRRASLGEEHAATRATRDDLTEVREARAASR